jgi:hypothetical protein
MRWGQDRERHVPQHGRPQAKKEVPTLEQFASRFIDGHARANRQKPSGIAAKETILEVHLVPLLGAKRLNEITNEDIQRLKGHLKQKAAKTVNNVLTVLNTMLKKSVEWDVIFSDAPARRTSPCWRDSRRTRPCALASAIGGGTSCSSGRASS